MADDIELLRLRAKAKAKADAERLSSQEAPDSSLSDKLQTFVEGAAEQTPPWLRAGMTPARIEAATLWVKHPEYHDKGFDFYLKAAQNSIDQRTKENPISSGVGNVTGFTGSLLADPVAGSIAGAMTKSRMGFSELKALKALMEKSPALAKPLLRAAGYGAAGAATGGALGGLAGLTEDPASYGGNQVDRLGAGLQGLETGGKYGGLLGAAMGAMGGRQAGNRMASKSAGVDQYEIAKGTGIPGAKNYNPEYAAEDIGEELNQGTLANRFLPSRSTMAKDLDASLKETGKTISANLKLADNNAIINGADITKDIVNDRGLAPYTSRLATNAGENNQWITRENAKINKAEYLTPSELHQSASDIYKKHALSYDKQGNVQAPQVPPLETAYDMAKARAEKAAIANSMPLEKGQKYADTPYAKAEASYGKQKTAADSLTYLLNKSKGARWFSNNKLPLGMLGLGTVGYTAARELGHPEYMAPAMALGLSGLLANRYGYQGAAQALYRPESLASRIGQQQMNPWFRQEDENGQ